MGACSPAPVLTPAIEKRVMAEIIGPTLDGLHNDGVDYTGFLYAGLMIDAHGNAKVLEYNCRFGDPETQPIMTRLQSDLVSLCEAGADGRLAGQVAAWDPRAALGVVMAAGGYPDSYETGKPISGLSSDANSESKVFHAGTAIRDGQVVTSGGRVLCVVGLGGTLQAACDNAYAEVRRIDWDNAFYRRDIGHRAIAHEQHRT
jgi:phosphoribosylamine--glycine ligase